MVRKSDGARLRGVFTDEQFERLPFVKEFGYAPSGYHFGHTDAYLAKPLADEKAIDVLRAALKVRKAERYELVVSPARFAPIVLEAATRFSSRRAAQGAFHRAAKCWRGSQSNRSAKQEIAADGAVVRYALRERRSHRSATVATLNIVETV
jgi:hypothetical protein